MLFKLKGRKEFEGKELELVKRHMGSTQEAFQTGFISEAALGYCPQITSRAFHFPMAMVTTFSKVSLRTYSILG